MWNKISPKSLGWGLLQLMVRMTKVFRGSFNCKIDSKGRLSLPTAYRSSLDDTQSQLVITNSQYQNRRCLDAYTIQEWEKLEKKIAGLPQLNSDVQAFQRFYVAGGLVIEPDSQKRLLVPQSLRKFAAIESEVVLIGMGHKLEIWSEAIWSELHKGLADNFEGILNSVSQLEAVGA